MSESILAFATSLAEQAGDLIVEKRISSSLTLSYKKDIELVTNADIAADEFISQTIKKHHPSHQILSEESNPDMQSIEHIEAPLWIIDPIDGTVNYAHHHSQVAISIAYVVRGKVQVAVVYSPFQAEMFTAIRQQGAWLNDQPIRCSSESQLGKALVATGFPYDKHEKLPLLMSYLENILQHCADIRRMGSAALDICWVAMGRLDAYYETVSVWDCAAAQLVAQEAGAKYGHFLPVPKNVPEELHPENLLISAPALYEPIKKLLLEAHID